ncbi:MAG TPA: DnaJ domain-containing protein [Pyrinomonadaceae bacterium]|nr:DnaJ domain-containing protein [Pyrinomonadaceae bacterium]
MTQSLAFDQELEQSAVVDYYKTLGVERAASAAEIKSAYRRLARERHPDVNGGSEDAAREFALLALAYRTLSDPQERAHYDSQWERGLSGGGDSVLNSNNIHAQRMRKVAAQARWDRAVDLWLEAERRETFARTQAVFTTVTLFLSTFFVAMLRPHFWHIFSSWTGRAIVVTLFLIGIWHLATRLREYLERYTYRPKQIQDSIMHEEEKQEKPFTRLTAYAFLLVGYGASLGAGLYIGAHAEIFIGDLGFFFRQHVRPEMLLYPPASLLIPDLLLYPPIAVLIVDTMHTIAAKIDA